MSNVSVLGIDLAKNVFQLHGNDARGKQVLRKALRPEKAAELIANMPSCLIAMEACSGAHFYARKFRSYGHDVKLISPQFIKPFVKGNKDDAKDAEAICEAAVRPNMRFVPIKETEHIDIQQLHRIRTRLVKNRTQLINQMRGMLYEHGIKIAQGRKKVEVMLLGLLADDSLRAISSMLHESMCDLEAELIELNKKILKIDQRIIKVSEQNEVCQRLQKIKGIGPVTASALVAAVPQPQVFENGRQFAAWLGLVPRHSGTGGKNRILGISKRGDQYLRTLLIHGARAAVRTASRRQDRTSRWCQKLGERKDANICSVALANKNARTVLALMKSGESYNSAYYREAG